ncbi:MAG TPA: EF-P lysine aminoacylase EpmA [Methylovirgula sp.]
MSKSSFWWRPEAHAERRRILQERARLMQAARRFFDGRGFIEVDPAILQVSPGNEAHIAGFATQLVAPDATKSRLYLHASPEFAAKKLLAAGEERLYCLGHVFRNGERGRLHHPEFTMLEWYRANAPVETLFEDCAALLAAVADAVDAPRFSYRGHEADPHAEPEILTVGEAFARYAAVDLLATYDASSTDRDRLARDAQRLGIRMTQDDRWSDLFSKILSEKIEPRLGQGRPTLLVDYPAPEAALAKLKDDGRFAERFELYVCGVELANGFGELTDAVDQKRRFENEMAERQEVYGEAYPIDPEFLDALKIMPEASGIALGFDRLVMLATDANHIEQVIWTPVAEKGSPL